MFSHHGRLHLGFAPPPHHYHHHHNRSNHQSSEKKKTVKPIIFESEEKLKDDLKDYLVNHDWSYNIEEWKSFFKMYLSAPISFSKKIKIMTDILQENNFKLNNVSALEVIVTLVYNCKDATVLINDLIPLFTSAWSHNKEKFREDMFSSLLSNSYNEAFYNNILEKLCSLNLSSSDFSKILILNKQLGSCAANNLNAEAYFFTFSKKMMHKKDFNDSDSLIKMLSAYFENYNKYRLFKGGDIYQPNNLDVPKNPGIILMIHRLLAKNADIHQLFDLLQSKPGVNEQWLSYVELLADMLKRGVDKKDIVNLLSVELSQNNIIPTQKKPLYKCFTEITKDSFGAVFYQLAKNGLLPPLKYNDDMAKEVFLHILSLPDEEEKFAALRSIRKHEDTQLNDFFWKQPAVTFFCGTQPMLGASWKKKIDAALPQEQPSPAYKP